ncbi:hypothetical protein CRUP_008419, partial [Coryphaenoides rupestris]
SWESAPRLWASSSGECFSPPPAPRKPEEIWSKKPATAKAEGRGPWENSSATMNQGMGPGPISKKATKEKMAAMLTGLTSKERAMVISTAETAIPSRPIMCSDLRPARSTTNS